MRTSQNGENRNCGSLSSNPQTIGKASLKQTKQSEVDLQTHRFSLCRVRGKGKQRRHETRCFLPLPLHPHTSLYTHTHTRKHQSVWMKTWVWTKVWSVRPCCVAGEQRALMQHLNICRVPACGSVNGSKQPRYEPHQSSWFVVGSSCCLALHKSVIIQCFFSEARYK